MIEIKENITLQEPLDLANAYGEHLLVIGSEGKPAAGSEIPKDIFIRYESAQEYCSLIAECFHGCV